VSRIEQQHEPPPKAPASIVTQTVEQNRRSLLLVWYTPDLRLPRVYPGRQLSATSRPSPLHPIISSDCDFEPIGDEPTKQMKDRKHPLALIMFYRMNLKTVCGDGRSADHNRYPNPPALHSLVDTV
jgi:hypothetical protein